MQKNFFTLLLLPICALSTTIYDIQYTEDPDDGTYPSPLAGETVTISGIVTAVKSGQYNNFYIEERPGGAWHGAYVYDNTVKPTVGDSITLACDVDEYFGMTELKNVSSYTIHSHDNLIPGPTEINTGVLGDGGFEAEGYEGVLVMVRDVTVTRTTDSYGQWYVDDGSGECEIEDGLYHYESYMGETFLAIIGAGSYGFEEYEINPRDEGDLINTASGTGKAIIYPDVVFTSSYTSLRINVAEPFDTLTRITIKIPYQWTFSGEISLIALSGEAFQNASFEIEGDGSEASPWIIDITNAKLIDSAAVVIDSLLSPDEPGRYTFLVKTATLGDEPVSIRNQPSVRVLTKSGIGEATLQPLRLFKGETLGIRMKIRTEYDLELNRVHIKIPSTWYWAGHVAQVRIISMGNPFVVTSADSIYIENIPLIDSVFIYIDSLAPSFTGTYEFEVSTGADEEPLSPIEDFPSIIVIDSIAITDIAEVQAPGEDGYTPYLLGEDVNVMGFVTSPSFGDYTSFYLQDETGGVNIFSYDPLPVNLGENWIITGEITEYNGLTEVKIGEVEGCLLMSDSCTTHQIDSLALVLEPSQGITETMEGGLIEIRNAKIQTLPYEIPGNFQIWNAKTLIDVRIQDGIGIEIPIEEMEVGDYWNIRGIAGQYDTEQPYSSGYQLLPRFLRDLEDVSLGEPTEELIVKIYPNPFSPNLGECLYIETNSPPESRITIRIFDLEGRGIKTLTDNLTGGINYTDWDGTDENGGEVSIGIYILHVQSVTDGETEEILKPVIVGTPLD